MKYIVDDKVLFKYKEIIDKHAYHDEACDWNLTEFCNCGLHARMKELRELCRIKVKEYDEQR